MGDAAPVDHQAAQNLAGPVGAQIQVPQQTLAAALVIGWDAEGFHPLLHDRAGGGVRLRLEQAVRNVDDRVGAALVVPDAAGAYGELDLVAVALRVFRAVDGLYAHVRPTDAGQGVLHPLTLGLQLFGVAHVAEAAAPALEVIRAVGRLPGGRESEESADAGPGSGVADVLHRELHVLPPERALDEHRHALHPSHTVPLGGVAGDDGSVCVSFQQRHKMPAFL